MNTTNVYKKAVYYVETLRWSVIPLKPNSKEPLIPWSDFQHRLPTSEELRKWFLNSPNNIGIVCGKISNLSVLDADELKNLPHSVSSSITVLTRRGKHLYFAYSGEVNSAGKINDKIDVRGNGGYVCAPPSIVAGHRYRFISPVVRADRLAPFPSHLLGNTNVNNENSTGGTGNGKPNHKPENWLSEAIEGLREGNRNQTFTSIVGRLCRDGHTPSDILSFLRPHAVSCGFELDELETIIQSVQRYENGQGKSHVQYRSDDKAEDIESFLQGEEKVEWIVPGVIAKSSLGFVAGLPESLKTWVLMDLAIEASRGGEWLGYKADQVRVLFVDQERWKGETRRRFKKLIKGKGFDDKDMIELHNNLHVQVGTTTRLNLDESFEAFRRKLAELKPGLVIIDSFATFSTVAENDRVEVQKVLERLKQLRQEFGCTILMIDHEGKSVLNPEHQGETPNAFSMVGSVAKPAAAESVFTVRRASDTSVTIHHTKSTLAPAIPPITVTLEDVGEDAVILRKL